jgi:hypothetical protein
MYRRVMLEQMLCCFCGKLPAPDDYLELTVRFPTSEGAQGLEAQTTCQADSGAPDQCRSQDAWSAVARSGLAQRVDRTGQVLPGQLLIRDLRSARRVTATGTRYTIRSPPRAVLHEEKKKLQKSLRRLG